MRLSRNIFLIAALTCAFLADAQTPSTESLSETIVATTPLSKNDQWHNLKKWVSLTFDNSSVIDMQDEGRGTMIIKWSCPVKLESDYISANAISTYVIDVRDGKYRLQRINPRISFQFSRPDVYESLDPERAEQATSDIRLINGIATRVYEGAFEWPANERYDELIDACREVLSATPQYRTDRDRDKGKITDEWRKAEHNWKLLRTPLLTLKNLDASMVESLNKALKENDDF
ncbi:MAG: hypothetical protein K2J10_08325 [Muribaculaceae bacterium]|nr:hypothetical protein [Muribaculaceae bacterium]